jgi:hypothetical protein
VRTWAIDDSSLTLTHDNGATRVDAVVQDILRVRVMPTGEPAPRRDLLLRLHLPTPPAQVQLDGRPTDNWHWNAEQWAV